MAELGVTSSIISIIQLTAVVVKYIRDVRNAPKVREVLVQKLECVEIVLKQINLSVQSSAGSEWADTLRSLGEEKGPLDQYKVLVETIAIKLSRSSFKLSTAPRDGVLAEDDHSRNRLLETRNLLSKIERNLQWPFQEKEIELHVQAMEKFVPLFIFALNNDHLKLSLHIQSEIKGICDILHEINSLLRSLREEFTVLGAGIGKIQQSQDEKRLFQCIYTLSPIDFSARRATILDNFQAGTGLEFLEHEKFLQFQNFALKDGSRPTILFCSGIPGAGKTFMAARSVEWLRSKYDSPVACLFCEHKNQETQSAQNLLASILKQIIEQSSSISRQLRCQLLDSQSQRHTTEHLVEMLVLQLFEITNAYCVIDGLDELSQSARSKLCLAIQRLPSNIAFLITSRPIGENYFPNVDLSILEIRASNADIGCYVRHRVETSKRLQSCIGQDESACCFVTNTIVQKCQGMFLLARLHMDSLEKKHTKKQIYQTAEELPSEINTAYEQTFAKMSLEDHEVAMRALWWTLLCIPAPRIEVLQYALARSPDDTEHDAGNFIPKDLLLAICSGLLQCESPITGTVRLCHHTLAEFLLKTGQDLQRREDIEVTCRNYLASNSFQELMDSKQPFHEAASATASEPNLYFPRFALRPRSLGFWFPPRDSPLEAEKMLWSHERKVRNFAKALTIIEKEDSPDFVSLDQTNLRLPLALYLNESHITKWLVESMEIDPNLPTEKGMTALGLAALKCNFVRVSMLLKHGADPNAPFRHYMGRFSSGTISTPLWAALTFNDHNTWRVVDVLLSYGANNVPKWPQEETCGELSVLEDKVISLLRDFCSNLDYSGLVWFTDPQRLQPKQSLTNFLFLRVITDVFTDDDKSLDNLIAKTIIYHSRRHGRDCVIDAALARSDQLSKFQILDSYNRSALFHSVANGYTRFSQKLIRHSWNVDAADTYDFVPLYSASINRDEQGFEHVQMLVEANADVNRFSDLWGSPLILACLLPSVTTDMIEYLLEKGAQVNVKCSAFGSPLQCTLLSALVGDVDNVEPTVRLLLNYGADLKPPKLQNLSPEVVDRITQGPLQFRTRSVISQMFECNFRPYSLLELAIMLGQPEVVKLLLDNGADPFESDGHFPSPIMAIMHCCRNNTSSHFMQIIEILVNTGVDLTNLPSGRPLEIGHHDASTNKGVSSNIRASKDKQSLMRIAIDIPSHNLVAVGCKAGVDLREACYESSCGDCDDDNDKNALEYAMHQFSKSLEVDEWNHQKRNKRAEELFYIIKVLLNFGAISEDERLMDEAMFL